MKTEATIDVRQAAEMITEAWWGVSTGTIAHCWRKAGLQKYTDEVYNQLEMPAESDRGDAGDVNKLWDQVRAQLSMPPAVTFAGYIMGTEDVQASVELPTE